VITDVSGIILWSQNPKELAEFYSDVIGFTKRTEREDFTSFEPHHGFRLSIGGVHEKVKRKSIEPYRIMLNLMTDNIVDDFEALKLKGIIFSREPELEKWGGWMATFADLDGNILQLMQNV
jgi:uncharacterized glyoxalase superfamily protein PhnB